MPKKKKLTKRSPPPPLNLDRRTMDKSALEKLRCLSAGGDKKSYLTDFEKMNLFFLNSKFYKNEKMSSYILPRNIPTDFEKNPNIGCRVTGVDRQTD